jgi:hypothetical protein
LPIRQHTPYGLDIRVFPVFRKMAFIVFRSRINQRIISCLTTAHKLRDVDIVLLFSVDKTTTSIRSSLNNINCNSRPASRAHSHCNIAPRGWTHKCDTALRTVCESEVVDKRDFHNPDASHTVRRTVSQLNCLTPPIQNDRENPCLKRWHCDCFQRFE